MAYLAKEDVEIYSCSQGIKEGTGEDIIKSGLKFIGLEYFWGGLSSFGYDCSSFSYTVHKAKGYKISRDAIDQSRSSKKIEINNRQRGDLLSLHTELFIM
ncbi:NlpC/P60 family protein [Pseudogracilibacillus sp. SO30301A]